MKPKPQERLFGRQPDPEAYDEKGAFASFSVWGVGGLGKAD